ncbi:MAG: adenosine deaminase [Pseudomonadota bacterium]
MTANVPKAELHCHIEGAASPALAKAQARKYDVDISAIINGESYVWRDFTSFLEVYDTVANLFRTRDDFRLLAETYLSSLAEDGAIYSEFFISPDHARESGIDPAEYISGLADGIAEAREKTGIEARMIAIGLRHMGPQAVLETARWIAANPHRLVTGFGMAGDERMHDVPDFLPAHDAAREAGLGISTHAGELCGPTRVRQTVEQLKPDRIGHGVRAIEDQGLVELIADREIVLEVCPASNVALEIYPDFVSHPLPKLVEAGCLVTLNSDDPPYFGTSLANEYRIAAETFGYSDEALLEFTINAIKAAFIDGETRTRLLEKCRLTGLG